MISQIKNALDSGILFICAANSARSQIAEGLARKVFSPSVHIQSAGSKPAKVHPLAIEVMKEIKIDISSYRAKSFRDIDISRVGLVINLCVNEIFPSVPSPSVQLSWFLPNPAICCADHENITSFRKTRDDLITRIDALHEAYCTTPVMKKNTIERELVLHDSVGYFDPFRRLGFLRSLVPVK